MDDIILIIPALHAEFQNNMPVHVSTSCFCFVGDFYHVLGPLIFTSAHTSYEEVPTQLHLAVHCPINTHIIVAEGDKTQWSLGGGGKIRCDLIQASHVSKISGAVESLVFVAEINALLAWSFYSVASWLMQRKMWSCVSSSHHTLGRL